MHDDRGTMDPNRSQPAWILNRYAALVSVYSYVKGELSKGEFTMQQFHGSDEYRSPDELIRSVGWRRSKSRS